MATTSALQQPHEAFQTAFDLYDEDEDELTDIPDFEGRELITANEFGNCSFTANLDVVQCGTLHEEPAMLVKLGFHFDFQKWRMSNATTKVTFLQASEHGSSDSADVGKSNDPVVKKIGPCSWRGQKIKSKTGYEFQIFPEVGFLDASVKMGSYSQRWEFEKDYHMQLHAMVKPSERSGAFLNMAQWTVDENGRKKEGILRNFSVAALVRLPKLQPSCIKMRVDVITKLDRGVRPSITLKSVNDAPVFLDRHAERGEKRYGHPGQDFGDPAFPWAELNKDLMPHEYSSSDMTDT